MEHLTYSPNLALNDFWHSDNKVVLKEIKISGYWTYPTNVMMALKAIPQQEFQKCFQQ
jgi:hypothetical protein